MSSDYIFIDNGFHDKLEVLVLEKKKCEVVFLNEGGKVTIQGRIERICQRDDMEFLQMQSGQEIRLDKLVKVDGSAAVPYC